MDLHAGNGRGAGQYLGAMICSAGLHVAARIANRAAAVGLSQLPAQPHADGISAQGFPPLTC